MQEFRGKVAVVTGAASGIGLALAQKAAAEGMKVVLSDIEAEGVEKAASDLRATGAEAIGVRTDVSQPDQVEALAVKTVDTFGAVHLVCNNAGVATFSSAWEHSVGDWQWVLGVNLWGP